jgi:aminopeptidase N
LALEQVRVEVTPRGYRLTGTLQQTQKASPFRLRVPLVIGFEDGAYRTKQVEMAQRQQTFRFDLGATPLSLSVDPWFDLFRSLEPAETPPALSQFFGAERVLILLPAAADAALMKGYRRFATRWAQDYKQAEILLDRELDRLPDDRPVLLLGWENRFTAGFLENLSSYPFSREAGSLSLWGQSFDTESHSFALTRRPADSTQTRLWVATRTAESLTGLARKLPHYGKYSALAFSGDAPDNRLKRQWPVIGSPLQVAFSKAIPSPPPEPPPLSRMIEPVAEQ